MFNRIEVSEGQKLTLKRFLDIQILRATIVGTIARIRLQFTTMRVVYKRDAMGVVVASLGTTF